MGFTIQSMYCGILFAEDCTGIQPQCYFDTCGYNYLLTDFIGQANGTRILSFCCV